MLPPFQPAASSSQGNTEAHASFEEFVNYSHVYDRKIILLFKNERHTGPLCFFNANVTVKSRLSACKSRRRKAGFSCVGRPVSFLVGELTNVIIY